MMNLDSLNQFKDRSNEPTNLEFIYYLFWEKGIDLNSINQLPLPYIFSVLKAHNFVKNEEIKAHKKANRKK